MPPFFRGLLVGVTFASLALSSGCKLLKNDQGSAGTEAGVDVFFNDPNFDADKMARDLWDSEILPYLEAKAGDFVEVMDLIAVDPDQAGELHGHRAMAEGSPWNMVVRISGKVASVNVESRAGTAEVDVNGDGQGDATIQIGPVVRGTSIRDSLDFIPFGAFTNQIDYAQFGKAINGHIVDTILSRLLIDDLAGREVEIVGVFELDQTAKRPAITPATFDVRAPSS